MKLFIVLLSLVFFTSVRAQNIPPESIKNDIIGWIKVYHFKGFKEPFKVDDKIYSIAQLSIADSFANWIQASYLPKGGLGDVRKSVSEKLTPYNQYRAALPYSYGAYAKIYTELRYNSAHKIEPVTNSHLLWRIMANEVIGSPAKSICDASHYYFTMPSFDEQGYGEPTDKIYDLTVHPILNKYATYFQRNSATGNERSILLFRDNKSPFIKVTKEEYLKATEEGIKVYYETEKKKIYQNNTNNQKSIDYFMKALDEKNTRRLEVLRHNREMYRDRIQEPAKIFTEQPDVFLENYPDVFEGSGASSISLQVYKIDPVVWLLCKKDQPQWLVVSWTTSLNESIGIHLYESIINNFNFDYLYNFFFNPEKVKGQPYSPLKNSSKSN